ncbi:MAG: TVP38/TMEM64 family protein [Leptolyngbyaceae cyanobacterium]
MMPLHPWFTRHRLIILGMAIASCLAVLIRHTVPSTWWRSLLDRGIWVQMFDYHPTWGVILFLIAHTMAAVIGVPGTFLVVIGGVVFGLVWGTIWSVVGATLGAIAAFCLARYCLRHWVERRWSHHKIFQTLDKLLHQSELNCVLAIRFAPISPFSVVNFLFGLTRVPLRTYVVGTSVGIIPGTLAYTWLGVAGHEAWSGHGLMPLILALGGLALLSVIPVVLKRGE